MTNIEKNVMRRIYTIRILRPFFSGLFFGCLVLVAALFGIGQEVWVARVFANGPQDFLGHSLYLVYAFEHTRIIVQTLVLATLVATLYLARETAQLLARVMHLQFA